MAKPNTKPQILLTNDDGINAPGIAALYNAISGIGDCTVVAPAKECSASGHSITINKPIRVEKVNNGLPEAGWAIGGTPADCIKFAVKKILKKKPDLIISGINQGSNTAVNTIYSGTVAGASEGGLMNIPSFAISIAAYDYRNFSAAEEVAQIIAHKLLNNELPDYTFLNVNVPPVPKDKIAGIRITHQGKTRYNEIFDEHVDSSGGKAFWLRGEKILLEHSDDSDEIAVSNNFVAVTPLQHDLTDYQTLEHLHKWDFAWNNKP